MSARHAFIRRNPHTPWYEPKIVLAHVEVQLGPDDVFRTVNGNSEKLPIECAAAAAPYNSVLVVEIREGDAHLVVPTMGRGARRLAGEWNAPPTFDHLYQVDGLSAEVAQATSNFHQAMQRAGVWPYGDQMPAVRIVFPEAFAAAAEELDKLRAAHAVELAELKRLSEARFAALEEAYANRPPAPVAVAAPSPAQPPAPAASSPAQPPAPDPTAAPSAHSPAYEARAKHLDGLNADGLREIIRGHGLSGSSSKAEMRSIILGHEFPDEIEE